MHGLCYPDSFQKYAVEMFISHVIAYGAAITDSFTLKRVSERPNAAQLEENMWKEKRNTANAVASMLFFFNSDWTCLKYTRINHCSKNNTSVYCLGLRDNTFSRVGHNFSKSYRQPHCTPVKQMYISLKCLRGLHIAKNLFYFLQRGLLSVGF